MIDRRDILAGVDVSGLRRMPLERFRELFSISKKDSLFANQTENLYLVSNDFPIGKKGWTEAARAVETRRGDGVVFAIMGGMDSAFDFWVSLEKKGLIDQNGVLVFLEINPIQIELGRWKLDLVARHDSYPKFLGDFMPMPGETRKRVREMEKTGDWYLRAIRDVFSATSSKPLEEEWFLGIREGMTALGYPAERIDRLVGLIKKSGQMATNERGIFTRGVQGGILEPLTNYLLYQDNRGITWQNPENYGIVHRSATDGRVKIAEMPLQKLPESELFSVVATFGSVVGVHVSNVPQYLPRKNFSDITAALKALPEGDQVLLQYFAVDTFNDLTIGKVITLGEVEKYREEIQMRNWTAGEIDEKE